MTGWPDSLQGSFPFNLPSVIFVPVRNNYGEVFLQTLEPLCEVFLPFFFSSYGMIAENIGSQGPGLPFFKA